MGIVGKGSLDICPGPGVYTPWTRSFTCDSINEIILPYLPIIDFEEKRSTTLGMARFVTPSGNRGSNLITY